MTFSLLHAGYLRSSYQLIGMLGPCQVADLRAGISALQGLAGQGVPKPKAAVSRAAPRGQQAVLVW